MSSSKDFKPLLLQLGRYMHDVFTAQLTRRLISGFFLCRTIMKLWVFNHPDPYSSGEFNIHKEPEQFIWAIAGYVMMSDEELGLNTFSEPDGEDQFITVMKDATGRERSQILLPIKEKLFKAAHLAFVSALSALRNSHEPPISDGQKQIFLG